MGKQLFNTAATAGGIAAGNDIVDAMFKKREGPRNAQIGKLKADVGQSMLKISSIISAQAITTISAQAINGTITSPTGPAPAVIAASSAAYLPVFASSAGKSGIGCGDSIVAEMFAGREGGPGEQGDELAGKISDALKKWAGGLADQMEAALKAQVFIPPAPVPAIIKNNAAADAGAKYGESMCKEMFKKREGDADEQKNALKTAIAGLFGEMCGGIADGLSKAISDQQFAPGGVVLTATTNLP